MIIEIVEMLQRYRALLTADRDARISEEVMEKNSGAAKAVREIQREVRRIDNTIAMLRRVVDIVLEPE